MDAADRNSSPSAGQRPHASSTSTRVSTIPTRSRALASPAPAPAAGGPRHGRTERQAPWHAGGQRPRNSPTPATPYVGSGRLSITPGGDVLSLLAWRDGPARPGRRSRP